MITYDSYTIDSTGAFLIGELERLDQEMHGPLVDYTWSRDIDLREDVSIADETSSFTNSQFAAAGGIKPTGKSFIGKDTNAITGISLDIGKTASPLYLWGMELGYTIPELLSAMQMGRPVDTQKYEGIKLKHQMDIDEMVYIGDSDLGKYGLINNTAVVAYGNVANGAQASPLWTNKTPDEIVFDITDGENTAWAAAGYAVAPSKLLISPKAFTYLVSQKVSQAGNMSLMNYVKENSLCMAKNGKPLDIQPVKWLTGAGAGGVIGVQDGHDRMVFYTQERKRVRYPLVPLQKTPLEYRSIFHLTTYFGRLGCVEFVYPETMLYRDGFM